MDFAYSQAQRQIRERARALAEQEIRPIAERVDRRGEFPREIVRRLGEEGLLAITVPEGEGGAGADAVACVLALEEVGRASATVGAIMAATNWLYADLLAAFGTVEQRRRFLVPVVGGAAVGCLCLYESGAASDPTGLQATARRDGSHYVLNGRKRFVAGGTAADFGIVFAATRPGAVGRGISAFLVECRTPGFRVIREEPTVGIRGSGCAELELVDCRVLAEDRLGKEGDGPAIARTALNGARLGSAALAVGIARAALDASWEHAQGREEFGKPIGANQAIRFRLADMATETEAAWLLTLRAALARDRGRGEAPEASMAGLYASEVARRCGIAAVQIFGEIGDSLDYPAQRLLRDATRGRIYPDTSEIQQAIIADAVLA